MAFESKPAYIMVKNTKGKTQIVNLAHVSYISEEKDFSRIHLANSTGNSYIDTFATMESIAECVGFPYTLDE